MIRDGHKFHPHHLLRDRVDYELSVDEKTPATEGKYKKVAGDPSEENCSEAASTCEASVGENRGQDEGCGVAGSVLDHTSVQQRTRL